MPYVATRRLSKFVVCNGKGRGSVGAIVTSPAKFRLIAIADAMDAIASRSGLVAQDADQFLTRTGEIPLTVVIALLRGSPYFAAVNLRSSICPPVPDFA